jgi:hypothetical protein
MTYKDLTKEAYNKREEMIKELLDRLTYLTNDEGMFKGANIWLKELEELKEVISIYKQKIKDVSNSDNNS